MRFIKKLLKWTGITLLVLIILLILVPIIFKDQIKELVIKEVNKTLTAELSLRDFDLTFISTFPNMTIELMDAKLQGLNEFKDVTLVDIKNVQAHVGFWSVISGDQVEIDEVHITDPTINVKVLENGLANYDIVKPDSLKTEEELSEPSSFKLSLKEYSIKNATITYDDRSSNMSAKISNLNHTGTGDLTADIVDFETTTNMDQLSFNMDGIDYLTEVKTDAMVNLLMEFKESSSKFTLKENEIKLNEITFSVDGDYEMLADHDEMDIKLNASKATFKEFLSLIPMFYHSGYEGMLTSGSLALDGFVKGKLDETNLPGWDVRLKVNDASIKYPGLPGKISNIQIDGGSKYSGGDDLDKMTIDVPKFHANFSKNTIDANLYLKRLMSDPFIQSRIEANMDLATLKDYIPMNEGESYQGKLDADVEIKGKMSDLEKQDFEAFTAKGDLILSDVLYKASDLPNDVDIKKVKFVFSPQNLRMEEMKAKVGESDFDMNGKVDNYFGYLLRDETLKGDFNFNSNYLDLDAFIPASEEGESSEEESTATTTTEEPILVPDNIDFALSTNIKKVRYNGITVKDITGKVQLKDEIATLDNLNMNAMGGQIGLRGKYNTQNHGQPKMDFGYSLKDVDIQELTSNFLTVEKLAPITKYAFGKISSDMDMTANLTASFEPILSSLTSLGDLRSNNITIKGFKNLEKLESVTKLKNISNQTLKNFKTKFRIEDGKVHVTPFNVMLGKIGTDVSGYTSLDKEMDYNLKMNVPKDQLPKAVIKEVESLLSKANAAIPFINLKELPAIIPVNVKMMGDIKNPKITTDMKEAIMNAMGIKGNIVDNIKETIKDTVKQVINDQIDNAKEELEKQKKKILDDAQKEADKIVAEAKKAANVVRAEGDKQADELIKAAGSNPIKKKLAEEAAKKVRLEADKNAKKLEDQGQKQADNVMSKARENANKLG